MQSRQCKLLGDFADLSKGINSRLDEVKSRAQEEQHRQLLGQAAGQLRSLEEERQRRAEQQQDALARRQAQQAVREQARPLRSQPVPEPVAAEPTPCGPGAELGNGVVNGVDAPTVPVPKCGQEPGKPSNEPPANRRRSIPASRRKTMELMNIGIGVEPRRRQVSDSAAVPLSSTSSNADTRCTPATGSCDCPWMWTSCWAWRRSATTSTR